MFCWNCGTELPSDALFCPSCGQRVKKPEAEASAPEAKEELPATSAATPAAAPNADGSNPQPSNLAKAVQGGREKGRRKMPPLVFVVLILALLSGTAFAAYYVYTEIYLPWAQSQQQADSPQATNAADDAGNNPAAASNNNQDAPEEADENDEIKQMVLDRVEGWWHVVGNSREYYAHFHNGTMFHYMYNEDDNPPARAAGNSAVATVTALEGTTHERVGDPGYSINLKSDNGTSYHLHDSNMDYLELFKGDQKDTGSNDLERIRDDEVPAELASLAASEEANYNAAQDSEGSAEQDAPSEGGQAESQADSQGAQAATEQQDDGRHVVADSFEFDIPAYWVGRVDIEVAGDVVDVYVKDTMLGLLRVDVEDSGRIKQGGDIGSGLRHSMLLDNGNFVAVRSPNTVVLDPRMGNPTIVNYAIEQRNAYADLLTGGAYTTADALLQDTAGSDIERIALVDNEIVPTLKPRG